MPAVVFWSNPWLIKKDPRVVENGFSTFLYSEENTNKFDTTTPQLPAVAFKLNWCWCCGPDAKLITIDNLSQTPSIFLSQPTRTQDARFLGLKDCPTNTELSSKPCFGFALFLFGF